MADGKFKIKTTADLRSFIADMMVGVKNGHLDLDAAGRITKLAAQINESMYAEIKIARVRAEANKAVAEFGELAIGN